MFPCNILTHVKQKVIWNIMHVTVKILNSHSKRIRITVLVFYIYFIFLYAWSCHCIVNKVVQDAMRAQLVKYTGCSDPVSLWMRVFHIAVGERMIIDPSRFNDLEWAIYSSYTIPKCNWRRNEIDASKRRNKNR